MKKHARPLWPISGRSIAIAEKVLGRLRLEPELSRRIDHISAFFLGRPYIENSLGGGPGSPETMIVSLEAFDCVTYVETVLALANSSSAADFVDVLVRLRYRREAIDWFERNHYMTEWARANQAKGFVRNLTRGALVRRIERRLSIVDGLSPRLARFRCFPKRGFTRIADRIQTGDLILFVSTRPRLDVFHIGILVRNGPGIVMRHATRKAGAVIEQSLLDFLSSNRMSGFILLRPCAPKLTRTRPG